MSDDKDTKPDEPVKDTAGDDKAASAKEKVDKAAKGEGGVHVHFNRGEETKKKETIIIKRR